MHRHLRLLGMISLTLSVVGILAGCEEVPLGGTTTSAGPIPAAQCTPTDQDQYVYHPQRLLVAQSCIYITGTVVAVRNENDGDRHIQLKLDAQYQGLLRPANALEGGDLVVEPVCISLPVQPDALDVLRRRPRPAGKHPPSGAACLDAGPLRL